MSDEGFTMQMTTDGEVYPFVEDENANVTGAGHQDKQLFAAALNRYDAECSGASHDDSVDGWTPDDIAHCWVTYDEGDERLHPVSADSDGARPVTAVWGQR